MKLFEFCWSECDDSTSYLFSHPSKTNEEFDADVHQLLKQYGNDYLESIPQDWAGSADWCSFIIPKLTELGYSMVRPHYCFFPVTCILEHDADEDWSGVVGVELYKKAIEHNVKIRSL